jgi:hypothetical protein
MERLFLIPCEKKRGTSLRPGAGFGDGDFG